MGLADVFVNLKTDSSKFTAGLAQAEGSLKSFGASNTGMASGVKDVEASLKSMPPQAMVAAGAMGVLAGFVAGGIDKFTGLAGQVRQFSLVSGLSTQQSSAMIAVAGNLGLSTDDLSKSFGFLAANVQLHTDKFDKWGVSIDRNANGTVNLSGTMDGLRGKFQSTTDATVRDAMAKDLLGKSYQTLLPYLSDTSQHIDEIGKSAKNMGLILDPAQVQMGIDEKRAMEELHQSINGLQMTIGQMFIPTLTDMTKGLTLAVTEMDKLAGGTKVVQGAFNTLVSGALGVGTAGLSSLLGGLGHAHKSATLATLGTADASSVLNDSMVTQKQKLADTAQAVKDLLADQKAWDTAATKSALAITTAYSNLSVAGGASLVDIGRNMHLTAVQMDDLAKGAAATKSSMQGSFDSATSIVQHFASAANVSFGDVNKYLRDQVQATYMWSTNLQALVKAGVDQGLVKQLADAGPKTAPLVAALLTDVKKGNLAVINQSQTDLNAILDNTTTVVQSYEAKFTAAGMQLGQGLSLGFSQAAAQLAQAGVANVTAALAAMKKAGEIHSPSGLFAREVGGPLAMGVAAGMLAQSGTVGSAAASLIRSPGTGGGLGGGAGTASGTSGAGVINLTLVMDGQTLTKVQIPYIVTELNQYLKNNPSYGAR